MKFALAIAIATSGVLSSFSLMADETPWIKGPHYPGGIITASQPGGHVEKGVIHGAKYEIYSDFSASFGEERIDGNSDSAMWDVGCRTDAINDRKSCTVGRRGLTFILNGRDVDVCLFGADYPGSDAAVRVDKHKAHHATSSDGYACFGHEVSRQIVAQIKEGSIVRIRYQQWPNDYSSNDDWSASGFEDAYAYAWWALKHKD